MQKPSESLLAQLRALSIAERTYAAAYLDAMAAFGDPDDKPKRAYNRKPKDRQEIELKEPGV